MAVSPIVYYPDHEPETDTMVSDEPNVSEATQETVNSDFSASMSDGQVPSLINYDYSRRDDQLDSDLRSRDDADWVNVGVHGPPMARSPINAALTPWNGFVPLEQGADIAIPNDANSTQQFYAWWERHYADLGFKLAKELVDENHNAVMLQQRKKYTEELQKIKEESKASMQLMGAEVWCDSNGTPFYTLRGDNQEEVKSKRLLAVENFKAYRLTCYNPTTAYVIALTWDCARKHHLIYISKETMNKTGSFLAALRSSGLHPAVSGRGEKQAADALISYIFCNAKDIEIPYEYGWGITGDGYWHFAGDDEATLKEVLMDAK